MVELAFMLMVYKAGTNDLLPPGDPVGKYPTQKECVESAKAVQEHEPGVVAKCVKMSGR